MFGFLKKKASVDDLLARDAVPDYDSYDSDGFWGDLYGSVGTGPALKVTITDGPLDEPFTEYFESVTDFTVAVNSFHHLYGFDGPVTLVIEAV